MNDTPHARAQRVLDEASQRWSDQPLRAIFSCIGEQAPQVWYRPQRFSLSWDTLRPITDQTKATQGNAELRKAFQRAYAALPALNAAQSDTEALQRIDQALALFQDYAWAAGYEPLAADPQPRDDAVALYDYARTEAAKAAAGPDALLLGGDISGIQPFIYTIAASKAAKSLRARSFYLQLLTDAIAEWLLTKSGMPRTNLLYAGGGRFYVIVPAECADQLPEWRKTLGELLLHAHSGELYVALGCAPLESGFQAAQMELQGDRRRRFAALLDTDPQQLHQTLFEPHGHEGNAEDVCAICGFMGPTNVFEDRAENPGDPADEPQRLCKLCFSLIDLGQQLHHATLIVRKRVNPATDRQASLPRTSYKNILRELDMEITLHEHDEHLSAAGAQIQLIRLPGDSMQTLDTLRQRYVNSSVSFKPVVNVTPTSPEKGRERIKDFGTLADESIGIRRFGVLRMDVDDLGRLFGGNQQHSLARIAALSGGLGRFFEGWLGEICRNSPALEPMLDEYDWLKQLWSTSHSDPAPNQPMAAQSDPATKMAAQQVYSVYSGGDDLFLVGAWNVMPAVAACIQTSLHEYTGRNPGIHISGGLTLHTAKFPLYQAAKQAAKALESAKSAPERSIATSSQHKNAFTLLDQTIAWEHFPQVAAYYTAFIELLSANTGAARALLQQLTELYAQYDQSIQDQKDIIANKKQQGVLTDQQASRAAAQVFYGPWLWRGMYQLTQIRNRLKSNPQRFIDIQNLRDAVFVAVQDQTLPPAGTGMRAIEQTALAARWTQLFIRNKGDDRGHS